MLQLKAEANAQQFRDALRDRSREIEWAGILGATRVAQVTRTAEQQRLSRAFKLRGTEAFFRSAIRSTMASRAKPNAEVTVASNLRAGSILTRHEEPGIRRSGRTYTDPNSGRTVVGGFAIPVAGLRTDSANPPRSLYPTNILRRASRGRGAQTFFVLPSGIYERRHFGSTSAVRLLWAFRQQIHIRRGWRFLEHALATARERHPEIMRQTLREVVNGIR